MIEFWPGNRVKYVGYDTEHLINLEGVVVEMHGYGFPQQPNDTVPVMWNDGHEEFFHGVFRHNIKLIYRQPNWEV